MTILIVDDDPDIRRGLARKLRLRFAVLIAGGVEEAKGILMAAGGSQITTVITDVDMGDGTGFDLIRFIRTLSPVPTCTVMTGLVTPWKEAEADKLGAAIWQKDRMDEMVRELELSWRSLRTGA